MTREWTRYCGSARALSPFGNWFRIGVAAATKLDEPRARLHVLAIGTDNMQGSGN